jgi:beta-barrel assembly-enhancing protease
MAMKQRCITILLLGLLLGCGAAQADDIEQQLKDRLRDLVQKPAQSQQPAQPAQPAASPGLQDLKGLLGGYSQDEEIAIGRQIAGNLLGAAPLVKDTALQQYVNTVGRWIASQSERPDLPWHFGVIQSDDINAFAIPGGYVYVTRGLYRLLTSEADLAGVLGHEIGHVVRKHHLKLLQQSRLVNLGGELLAKQAGENEQIHNLIGSGAEVVARSLDKQAEFEADRMGVVLAARAGYEPFGLPAVLQNIGSVARDDGSVALLFKTHPLPDARLSQLGLAMADRFDATGGQSLGQRLYKLKP